MDTIRFARDKSILLYAQDHDGGKLLAGSTIATPLESNNERSGAQGSSEAT